MTAQLEMPTATVEERLSPEHEAVVIATLPLVGSRIGDIAATFYRRMFAAHPELLRHTFNRGNQAQGAQQKALAASVATFATLLVTPDAPSPRELLERIGHKHVSLGITPEQYQVVHDHLFAAIVEVLGEDVVTAEVAAAWDSVYWIMARTLIAFEAGLYAGAGVVPGDVFRTATVVERVEESTDVASFVLASPAPGAPLPDFVPGQYVSVGVVLPDGARQLRQYSLSGPTGTGRWRITVKRVAPTASDPAGEVSSWLHANLRAGDELQVTLPFGDLTVEQAGSGPVVLASAGIGLTPMLGILHHLADREPDRPVTVLHADRDAEDAALVAELREVVGRLPRAELHLWFERGKAPGACPGRMDVGAVILDPRAEILVCGPGGFLQALRIQLEKAHVPSTRVHYELFAPNDWLRPV
ncbi:nitric oxide dioxygenase [Georgenia satyanarayanai]|uniref:nitric oxide dioxygenase n=1 Tax=Georgenia satyanarayanai TaxID=860221 RepID=A0A2Y8ZX98_9MICO|nr:globin domain-containing protein [Georgenia satyanarayanai]PYG01795.1 nitric oxide dioxygenase [Georgenia satyanarayanai]SSA36595.1 nitric oxide dioxygenase [Georgenia satyanarayanai]